MRKRVAGLVLLGLFALGGLEARPAYDSFYLGLSPEDKIEVIRSFLSPEGRLFPLGKDTIFVRDEDAVLAQIRDFLKQDSALKTPQVRMQLRSRGEGAASGLLSRISFSIGEGKAEVGWKGGTQEQRQRGEKTVTALALSGRTAELRIERSEEELLVLRRRYLPPELLRLRVVDGEWLSLSPVVEGSRILVKVESSYSYECGAKKGRRASGLLSTMALLKPGEWRELGASVSESSSSSRENVFLGIENRSESASEIIELKAEILPF